MFDVSKVRAFAESLSDEDLTRECREAQELLGSFDSGRIKKCKEERLQERIQEAGGLGAAALLVAGVIGVGILTAGAAPAIAGAGLLAARAARGLTSGALDSACKMANQRIQSMPDADYLATFLMLESRLKVLVREQSLRERKVEGRSFWADIKSKAKALLSESSATPSSPSSKMHGGYRPKVCPQCGSHGNCSYFRRGQCSL